MARALGVPPVCPHVENTFVDYSTGARLSCSIVCRTEQPDATPECKDLCPDYYTCLTLLILAKTLVTTSMPLTPQLTPMAATRGVSQNIFISTLAVTFVCLVIVLSLLLVWRCSKKYRKYERPEQLCISVQTDCYPEETADPHLYNSTRMRAEDTSLEHAPESGVRELDDNDTHEARVDVHISPSNATYQRVTETSSLLALEATRNMAQNSGARHLSNAAVDEYLCDSRDIKHHNSPAVSLASGLSAPSYERGFRLNIDDGLSNNPSHIRLSNASGDHNVPCEHGKHNTVDHTNTVPYLQITPNTVEHTDAVPYQQLTPKTVDYTDAVPYQQISPSMMEHTESVPYQEMAPSFVDRTHNVPSEHRTLVCQPTDSDDRQYPFPHMIQ